MSDEPIRTAVLEDAITICGVTLRVAVLDDGQRVIHAEDVDALFNAWETAPFTDADALALARFVKGVRVPS